MFLGLNYFLLIIIKKSQYHSNNSYNIWANYNMESTIVQIPTSPLHKSFGPKLVHTKGIYDITYK